MRTFIFALAAAFVFPASARCDSVFHSYHPNEDPVVTGTSTPTSSGSSSSAPSGNGTTTNISITEPLDYSGPVTLSLPIVDSRNNANVISVLERARKSLSKNYCKSITPPGRQTFLFNNRVRKFRLTSELNHLDLVLSRTSGDYSGTANVTFRCLLF